LFDESSANKNKKNELIIKKQYVHTVHNTGNSNLQCKAHIDILITDVKNDA